MKKVKNKKKMVKKIKYLFSIFKNKKTSIDSLNQSVLDAQYAVRGLVPIRAAEIKREIVKKNLIYKEYTKK